MGQSEEDGRGSLADAEESKTVLSGLNTQSQTCPGQGGLEGWCWLSWCCRKAGPYVPKQELLARGSCLSSSPGRRGSGSACSPPQELLLPLHPPLHPSAPIPPSIHPSLYCSIPSSKHSSIHPSIPLSLLFSIPLIHTPTLPSPHPSASPIPTAASGKVGGVGLFLGASPWQRLPPPSMVAFP